MSDNLVLPSSFSVNNFWFSTSNPMWQQNTCSRNAEQVHVLRFSISQPSDFWFQILCSSRAHAAEMQGATVHVLWFLISQPFLNCCSDFDFWSPCIFRCMYYAAAWDLKSKIRNPEWLTKKLDRGTRLFDDLNGQGPICQLIFVRD